MKATSPQPKDLKQKLVEQTAGLLQWERVWHNQNLQKQDRLLRRLARIQQDAYAKKVGVDVAKPKAESDGEDEDGSVHIGDEFKEIHHHHTKAANGTTGAGFPWGWIVAAMLGAGSAGAIGNQLLRPEKPEQPTAEYPDTDTQYDLKLE